MAFSICPICGHDPSEQSQDLPARPPLTPQQRLILRALVRARGAVVPLDALEAFCSSRNALKLAVFRLRRKIVAKVLSIHGEGYALEPRRDKGQ